MVGAAAVAIIGGLIVYPFDSAVSAQGGVQQIDVYANFVPSRISVVIHPNVKSGTNEFGSRNVCRFNSLGCIGFGHLPARRSMAKRSEVSRSRKLHDDRYGNACS